MLTGKRNRRTLSIVWPALVCALALPVLGSAASIEVAAWKDLPLYWRLAISSSARGAVTL